MILLILSIVFIAVGIGLLRIDWEFTGITFAGLGAIALATIAIIWPVNYYGSVAEVDRYHALKETIEQARQGEVSEMERAALTQKMAEYNADLASVKYWNNTKLFDDFIADELAELEPLK